MNVVGNSIKYTPDGGTISVDAGISGRKVWIEVSDNGIGIPRQDWERIFDRFYRVDKARSRGLGGTGLGLSIARDTARVHGGDITAGPNPAGRGTRFEAEFPALKGGEGA